MSISALLVPNPYPVDVEAISAPSVTTGSLFSPIYDSSTTITIGAALATAVTIGRSGVSTTFAPGSTIVLTGATVSGGSIFNGIINANGGIGTTAGNLTLSPTGSAVVVSSGTSLTVDDIFPTSAATALSLSADSGQPIILRPGTTVIVNAGHGLVADSLASNSGANLVLSTASTDIDLNPGSGFVVIAGSDVLLVDGISTTTTNMSLELSGNGTGGVGVAAGKTFTADVIQPTTAGALTIASTSNGNIQLNPNGVGAVAVLGGALLTADTLRPTTAGALSINSTSNGNIQLDPNGVGAVAVLGGKTLTADTVSSTTANANLTLTANGTGVVQANSITYTSPGGTPTPFAVYETFTVASTYTGPWTLAQSCQIGLELCNNRVTMVGSAAYAACTVSTTVALTYTLPARFRPAAVYVKAGFTGINTPCIVFSNGAQTYGAVLVNTAGAVAIFYSSNSNFPIAPNNSGPLAWQVSWFVV